MQSHLPAPDWRRLLPLNIFSSLSCTKLDWSMQAKWYSSSYGLSLPSFLCAGRYFLRRIRKSSLLLKIILLTIRFFHQWAFSSQDHSIPAPFFCGAEILQKDFPSSLYWVMINFNLNLHSPKLINDSRFFNYSFIIMQKNYKLISLIKFCQ